MRKNPLGKFRVPFFMVDLGNKEIISLPNVPLEVTSSKPINWTKSDAPGSSFNPMQFSSFGSQEISFSIILANRNPILGNIHILKQFEKLRTPVEGLATLFFGETSNANPKVLFWYGTGNTLPLPYFVTKVDFRNRAFNQLGYPTVTDIGMDLTLNEESILYQMERMARMALSIAGMAASVLSLIQSFKGEKPY